MPIPLKRSPGRGGRAGAAIGPLLLAAAVGCSGADEPDRAAAPAPSPSRSPSPSPSPRFEQVEELETYCMSSTDEDIADGYPLADAYEGEGPHPVAVFTKTPRNNAEIAGYRLNDDGLYADWLPGTPSDAELIVCARDAAVGEERLDTCEYGEGVMGTGLKSEYPLYEQTYEFTVYALRTGEEVASGDIPSWSEKCPGSIVSDSVMGETSEVYTAMDHDVLRDEVGKAVGAEAP